MLKRLLVILLVLMGLGTTAQTNLIPNPSFELCDSICNRQLLGYYYYINGVASYRPYLQNWYSAKGTPDFFSINSIDTVSVGCWGGAKMSIPDSPVGYQFAKTDSHYVGLALYYHDVQNSWAGHNYKLREWVGVKLLQPLKQGVCYEFTMYVSRGEKSNRIVSSIGAYFSSDSLYEDYPSTPPYYISPWPLDSSEVQVQHNPWETIYDTVNWIPITGIFKAEGGEQYLYIGNLLKDDQYPIVEIDTLQNNEYCQLTYFFIDDVSLYEVEGPCAVGIAENIQEKIKIYPNPANDILSVNTSNLKNIQLALFDIAGRKLLQQKLTSNQENIDVSTLSNGIYICAIYSNNQIVKREKVLVVR